MPRTDARRRPDPRRAVVPARGPLAGRRAPRLQLRHGEGDRSHLTSTQGLVALSLDALSSVAYGPEAVALVLVTAGASRVRLTLPVTLVIAGLLVVLVVSYRQVIAVHPDGGGSYAVAKQDLGPRAATLAAAALVIDYVLTVAVSLAAGAATLGSAFPGLRPHLLATTLVVLVVLTAVNLYGIADSARVLMLPHLFALRGERPVHRYGVLAVAVAAGALLVAVDARTHRLLPLFAIGVFIGFTISQVGLVLHWTRRRPPRWAGTALLNGTGATLSAVATLVLLVTKFEEGAWVVIVVVPLLILVFTRIRGYYDRVGRELRLGVVPAERPEPDRGDRLVLVPLDDVGAVTTTALSAALGLGGEVVAVMVPPDGERAQTLRERWDRWDPGVRLELLDSPRDSRLRPIVEYAKRVAARDGQSVVVLVPVIESDRPRYRFMYDQWSLLLAEALRRHAPGVLVCMLPYRVSV
ncbi:hypothetical protein GCM10022254_46150 [Actinomadura meridiana]|uniref:APC family permease n=1 Tax=Actinomadura meridiana TaxID=559626 RepID=A0ABP8CAD7_9ACTN